MGCFRVLKDIFNKKQTAQAVRVQDITPLWNQAHPHLKPFDRHLPLPQGSLRDCPLCNATQSTLSLSVLVGFDGNAPEQNAVIYYCKECDRYVFDADERSLTAVNGRRWFNAPVFLNIEPTTRCNFRCWYCIGRTMQQVDMPLADLAKVFKHFPTLQTIALVGEGEPLLHPDFFKMAELARDHGVKVMITSNGSRFTEENIRKICESGISYISISIDSTDPETFMDSRPPGDLPSIWSGIEQLCRYRDQHGYQYPVLGLKGTLFPHTVDQLPDIIEEACKRGMQVYESFQPLNPMSTYLPCYPADRQHFLESIPEVVAGIARHAASARGRLESVQEFCNREQIMFDKNGSPNLLRSGCDEQWIYSLASGDITPCCQIKTPVSDNWNLFRTPLEAILSDQLYENTRFNLWNGIFPVYCTGCYKTGNI